MKIKDTIPEDWQPGPSEVNMAARHFTMTVAQKLFKRIGEIPVADVPVMERALTETVLASVMSAINQLSDHVAAGVTMEQAEPIFQAICDRIAAQAHDKFKALLNERN